MEIIKTKIILLIVIFLTGCASSTVNIKNDQTLKANQGIIATKLVSNWKGHSNPLLEGLRFSFVKSGSPEVSGELVMKKADDLKLIALPAGDYEWTDMKFGDGILGLSGSFKVKSATITYIGDILTRLEIGFFEDKAAVLAVRNTELLEYELKKTHPLQLKNYPMVTDITNIRNKPFVPE